MILHHSDFPGALGDYDDSDFPDINDSQPHVKLHDSPTHSSTPHMLPVEIAEELAHELAELRMEDLM